MKTEKFTAKSQEALNDAVKLAESFKNPAVEPVHLLVSLLQQADGLVVPALHKLGLKTGTLEDEASELVNREPQVSTPQDVTMTSAFKKLLDHAELEAKGFRDEFVSTEHFLLAMLDVDSSAQKLLKKSGVTRPALHK